MRTLHWALLLLAGFVGAAAAEPATDRPYRILVTNDDGIDAPGLAALVTALKPLGEVIVVAPKGDQSGRAHSTSIATGIASVVPLTRDGTVFGHAVDGTPADTVLLALYWLHPDKKFDIVVSGINYGANLGAASLYSGTVGAALEGALAGLRAIAVSQDHKRADYSRSATIAAALVERVLREPPTPYTFLNVNIPGGELKGVKVAPMGNSNQGLERFEPAGTASDGSTGLKIRLKRETVQLPETDTAFYLDGYVTITPLQADWTAYESLRALKTWAPALPLPKTP
jgi:5'-nucleotidase